MSKEKQKAPTQIEKAAAILKELYPNITATDRDEATKELELSEPTVNRYLTGHVKKVETAIDLIEFFKKRINEREKKLDKVA
jgi:hypothetical protein